MATKVFKSMKEVTEDVHRRFIKAGVNTVNTVAANARKFAIQNVQQNFTLRNNFTTRQIQFAQCAQNVQSINQIKSETGATEKAGYMARQEAGGAHRNPNGGNLIIPNTITRAGTNSKPVKRSYYYNTVKSRIVRGSTRFSSHKAALVARAFVAAKTNGFIRMNDAVFKVSRFRKAKGGNIQFKSTEILNLKYTQTITPKKEWLAPASENAAQDMQAIFNQQMDLTK